MLEKIWPVFAPKLNKIVHSKDFTFPKNQQFYQRIIPKVPKPKYFKDYRPIGILNIIPKYILNKKVFSDLKEHIKSILSQKLNFSYVGTHDCIIYTIEKLIENGDLNNILAKYDFSNAYGTIFHPQVLKNLNMLRISEEFIQYIKNYFDEQKMTQVLLSENEKNYISKIQSYDRGGIQGNLGSGELFTVEQLCFIALYEIIRTIFVDDMNDNIFGKTNQISTEKAKENETHLKKQSTALGFQLNEQKTEYIPFGADEAELSWNGLWMGPNVRRTKILGFNFITNKNKKIDTTPETEHIINMLNSRLRKVHALRTYNKNILTRVKIARKYIYHCLGSLHLIFRYTQNEEREFHKISVAVNNILRATGLRNTTPQIELGRVLGTNLKNFARSGLIINGIKNMQHFGLTFDRVNSIRQRRSNHSYMQKFIAEWNKLPDYLRKKLRFAKSLSSCKEILKKERKLEYNLNIHRQYKWCSY